MSEEWELVVTFSHAGIVEESASLGYKDQADAEQVFTMSLRRGRAYDEAGGAHSAWYMPGLGVVDSAKVNRLSLEDRTGVTVSEWTPADKWQDTYVETGPQTHGEGPRSLAGAEVASECSPHLLAAEMALAEVEMDGPPMDWPDDPRQVTDAQILNALLSSRARHPSGQGRRPTHAEQDPVYRSQMRDAGRGHLLS